MKHFTKLFSFIFLSFFFFLFLSTSFLTGQDVDSPAEFDLIPVLGGTRSMSMGGTYTAVNTGLNAIYGNPSGLADLDRSQILLGGLLRTYESAKWDEKNNFYPDENIKGGIYPKLTNLGVAFPVSLNNGLNKLVGAVSYRTFYDWSGSSTSKITEENGYTEENIYKGSGILNYLSLGLGTSFSEKYSLGVSYNLPIKQGYKQVYESEETISGDKHENSRIDEWGVNGDNFIQVGGMARLMPNLTIGASYLTKHEFKFKDGNWVTGSNDYKNKGTYNSETEWEFPGMYSLGIAYRFPNNSLLSAEIQNRSWEKVEINSEPLEYAKSGNSYRVGFETGKKLLLRLGFSLERLAAVDGDENPVNMKNIHAGFGWIGRNMTFDLGAVYKFYSFEVDYPEYYNGKQITTEWKNNYKGLILYSTLQYSFDFVVGKSK